MASPLKTNGAEGAATPEYWSQANDSPGTTVLSYAVRSGMGFVFLVALGSVLTLYCGWTMLTWITEAEFTLTLIVMLVLIPGSGFLLGVRCLDIALYAQTHYVLGPNLLTARKLSLFGAKTVEIARPAIVAVHQQYTPPSPSSSGASLGTWTTFVSHRDSTSPDVRDLALDGMGTREEARWLGPLVALWAGKDLKRGFHPQYVEADPAELPQL